MPKSPLREPNSPFQRAYFQDNRTPYLFIAIISIIKPEPPLQEPNPPFQRAYFQNHIILYIFIPKI